MARFLLVHGAAHGAWCWEKVEPALAALGHDTVAIDLPSHGSDPTPVADVTLDGYASAIQSALDAPSMVVGHSMGGYPISLAAERDPTHVRHLVYLAAYVPWPDHSLSQMRKRAPRQPLIEAIVRNPDGLSTHFDPEKSPAKFYQDCSPDVVAAALPRLCDQALQPMSVPVTLGTVYRSCPRSYILCENDGAIPPEFQETMANDFAKDAVYRMPTGHSPFFADPGGLAAILDRIARKQEA